MAARLFARSSSSTLPYKWNQLVVSRGAKKISRTESVELNEQRIPINDYLPENLTRKTRVYAWGRSVTGALGIRSLVEPNNEKAGIIEQALTPAKVEKLSYNNIVDVAACHGFSLFAVRGRNHVLLGCGLNVYNQLGWQEYERCRLAVLIEPVPIFLPVSNKSPPITVAGGRTHSLVLLENGVVYGLGSNELGQLGIPITSKPNYDKESAISPVMIDEEVTAICCGLDHSIFLTKSGSVYSCGLGADGQTGLGHYKSVGVPEKVGGDVKGEKIVQVSGCADSVLALSESGEVFGWGNSEYMQFNTACEDKQISVPKHIPVTKITGKVSSVAAGGTNCAVLNEKNQVYTWGFGYLGQGPKVEYSKEPRIVPAPVFGCDEFNPECKVDKLFAGLRHFAAITNLGDLYMWGANRNGSLGVGGFRDKSAPDVYYPLPVRLPGRVTKVSLGSDHTLAVVKT